MPSIKATSTPALSHTPAARRTDLQSFTSWLSNCANKHGTPEQQAAVKGALVALRAAGGDDLSLSQLGERQKANPKLKTALDALNALGTEMTGVLREKVGDDAALAQLEPRMNFQRTLLEAAMAAPSRGWAPR